MSPGVTLKGLWANNPEGAEQPGPEGPQREAGQGDCHPAGAPASQPFPSLPPFPLTRSQRWRPDKFHIHVSGASGQRRGREGRAETPGRPCPGQAGAPSPASALPAPCCPGRRPERVTHRAMAARGLPMGHPVPGSPSCRLQGRLPREPRGHWAGQGSGRGSGAGTPEADLRPF